MLPSVTLIPMAHFGNQAFYREANAEVMCSDISLYEGAFTPLKKIVRLFHPLIALKTNLTPQHKRKKKSAEEDFFQEIPGGPKVREYEYKYQGLPKRHIRQVLADASKKQYLKAIKKIPLRAKIAFPFIVIFALIAAPFYVTRDLLLSYGHEKDCKCKHCFDGDENSKENRKNIFDGIKWCLDQYEVYILEERNAILKNVLFDEIQNNIGLPKSISVQFGQGHMDELASSMKILDYSSSQERWVLAVSKDKNAITEDKSAGYGIAWDRFEKLPTNIITEDNVPPFQMADAFYSNTEVCIDPKFCDLNYKTAS